MNLRLLIGTTTISLSWPPSSIPTPQVGLFTIIIITSSHFPMASMRLQLIHTTTILTCNARKSWSYITITWYNINNKIIIFMNLFSTRFPSLKPLTVTATLYLMDQATTVITQEILVSCSNHQLSLTRNNFNKGVKVLDLFITIKMTK